MTDRKLLEDAARAVGLMIGFSESTHDNGRPYVWNEDKKTSRWWNPLTDDGDALRLAVAAGLEVECNPPSKQTAVRKARGDAFVWCDHGSDPYAATRLAITRAAAAIGKQMREKT